MKYCGNCGEGLADDALFCPTCGAKMKPGVATTPSMQPQPQQRPQPQRQAPAYAPQTYARPALTSLQQRFPIADTGTRIAAYCVDATIIGCLSYPFFIGLLCCFTGKDVFDGQSIGKKLFGLRVVDIDTGEPCSINQSVIRYNLSMCVLCLFADKDSRHPGDFLARTIVIKDH